MDKISIPSFTGQAACAEVGGDEWFPDKGASSRNAKAICRGCEVKSQCLEWALDHGEVFGIWGGVSERERRNLRARRERRTPGLQPINHGTEGGYSAHRRRGETPCTACMDGARIAMRRRRTA